MLVSWKQVKLNTATCMSIKSIFKKRAFLTILSSSYATRRVSKISCRFSDLGMNADGITLRANTMMPFLPGR